MKPNKVDRTAFKALYDASPSLEYWKKQPYEKRLEAAGYLNSVAYKFDVNNPPRPDKNYFKIRQRK